MPYIFLAILLSGLATGFGAARQYYLSEITGLNDTIAASNVLAQAKIEDNINMISIAEHEANQLRNELDKANEQNIKTINAYHDKLNTVRLRDPFAKSCRDTMPESNNSKVNQEHGNNPAELSTEFAEFLKSEAMRADIAAMQQKELMDFIQHNCGIKQ